MRRVIQVDTILFKTKTRNRRWWFIRSTEIENDAYFITSPYNPDITVGQLITVELDPARKEGCEDDWLIIDS